MSNKLSSTSSFVLPALALALVSLRASAQCPDQWFPIFGVPPGTDGQGWAATLWDPDGDGPQLPQPVVGGEFTSAGGISVNRIARFDGVMWLPFGTGAPFSPVRALTTWDSDGPGPQPAQLVAGGDAGSRIARWDGNAWQPFATGFSGTAITGVHSLTTWDPDGSGPLTPRLIAGGNFSTTPGGTVVNRVAWWDGAAWQPLGNGFVNGDTTALAVYDSDESGPLAPKLVAGGNWTTSGTTAVNRVAWWDGAAWQPLAAGFNGTVVGLTAWDADGPGPQGEQIVATGSFLMSGTTGVQFIARWDGAAWQPLGTGVGSSSYCVSTWDPDGAGPMTPEVVAAGDFTFAGGPGRNRIARWNGSVWQNFGTGMASGNVLALTNWDPDGSGPLVASPLAVGNIPTAGTREVSNVASWQGNDWRPLGNGVDGALSALTTWDADGPGPQIAQVVAGGPNIASGKIVNRIARFDGSEWQPLGAGVSFGDISDLTTWDPDGGGPLDDELVAVGTFTTAGGVTANRVARFDGTQWHAFGTGIGPQVEAVAVWDTDGPGGNPGVVVVGGSFTEAGGSPANYVAMWDGAAWQPMGSGLNNFVNSLHTFSPTGNPADSRVYAGGIFDDSSALRFIARWNGIAWEGVGGGTGSYVYDMTVWDVGPPILVVGGAFTFVGGTLDLAYRVAAWTGSAWIYRAFEPGGVFAGLNGIVYGVTTWEPDGAAPFDKQVIAGGSFTNVVGNPGAELNGIARWDGDSWEPLGAGVGGGVVGELITWDPDGDGPHNPVLVASGSFTTAGGLPGAFISAAGVCDVLPCPGDVNGDAGVDLADLSILLAHFGTPSGATLADGDLDSDGDVDLSDLTLLLSNFGTTCT